MLLSDPEALVVSEGPFAVDTEFHAENRYRPRLHLVQVRTEDGPAQLIDPHDGALMRAVAPRLLSRPWIVHAGRIDLRLLAHALGGVPDVIHDTQIAAGLVTTRYPAGLADLLADWCDVQLAKAETLSDWSRRPLSPGQLRYAALDVAHLHALWQALSERAAELGRSDVVLQACREARNEALGGPDPRDLWRMIPGGTGLVRPAAGALRALAIWREEMASRQDRPAMTVLGNRVMLDLAKRRPSTVEELTKGRRGPKKTLSANADALLGAIEAGARDLDGLGERLRPGTVAHARLVWWNAFAEIRALEASWAARLVLPIDLRERLASGRPLDTHWRSQLLEDQLEAAQSGQMTLRLPPLPESDRSA